MGQKVNPHGLRVGVIKDWDSRWFAKDEVFGDTLVADYKLRTWLKKILQGAGVPTIEIERDGKIMDFKLSPVLIKTNTATGDSIRMIGVSPAMQMKVGQVMKNSPAEKS